MSQYCFNGYLAALQLRSSPTILVEGPSDALLFSRYLHVSSSIQTPLPKYHIDDARILRSDTQPLGNRAKIEEVALRSYTANVPVFCILDREYDGFTVSHRVLDKFDQLAPPVPLSMLTRGHSVENYSFIDEVLREMLVHTCARQMSPAEIDTTLNFVQAILRICASFCWVAMQRSVLSRCRDLFEPAGWQASVGGAIVLDASWLRAALIARGINAGDAAGLIAEMKTVEAAVALTDVDTVRMFCHGVITFNGLMTGLATAARLVNPSVTVQMISGQRDESWRVMAGKAAQELAAMPQSGLEGLLAFLRNHRRTLAAY